MLLLVIGSALRAVCADQDALGLSFLEEAQTAPHYRLFSLDDRWAVLVDDPGRGRSILGELVEVANERWPEIVAGEPEGITPGPVELADGRVVTAALGDPAYLTDRGREITEFGGFAAYLRASGETPPAQRER